MIRPLFFALGLALNGLAVKSSPNTPSILLSMGLAKRSAGTPIVAVRLPRPDLPGNFPVNKGAASSNPAPPIFFFNRCAPIAFPAHFMHTLIHMKNSVYKEKSTALSKTNPHRDKVIDQSLHQETLKLTDSLPLLSPTPPGTFISSGHKVRLDEAHSSGRHVAEPCVCSVCVHLVPNEALSRPA